MIIEVNGEKIDTSEMSIDELIGIGLSESEADIIFRMTKIDGRGEMSS
jgi:hypothetical protein